MTAPAAGHTRLTRELAAHRAREPLEARNLARVRGLLAWLDDPYDEHADPTHLTGSAVVVDERLRVLLHLHKRLGRWLQPGGHIERGETPWDAALRETAEETGLSARHPDTGPQLIHVDVHEGPRGHVHLDLRYLLHADGDDRLRPARDESPSVAWCPPDDARIGVEASLSAAVAAALDATSIG